MAYVTVTRLKSDKISNQHALLQVIHRSMKMNTLIRLFLTGFSLPICFWSDKQIATPQPHTIG